MKTVAFAALAASFAARHPNLPTPGVVDSLAAAASPGIVQELQAGAVRGFTSAGSLQWVKAKSHFYVAGELILKDQFVQVPIADAKDLRRAGRADFATDEDVAAAKAEEATAQKSGKAKA